MKHVVFNFPFNGRNLKAIDGNCLLALLFIFFLKLDGGEQIIEFIILTNLFFFFFCQNEFLTVFILCLNAVHLRLLL